MIRIALPLLCLVLACSADARSYSSHRTSSRTETPRSRSVGAHTRSAARCQTCARETSEDREERFSQACIPQLQPLSTTGATKGPCPGYVIDHIQALKHSGTDSPDNMQWQTREEAKAKDLVE